MTYSEQLVEAIVASEDFTPMAMHLAGDRPGVITYGYGDTACRLGDSCTRQEAMTKLRARLDGLAAFLRSVVSVALTQGQFDALVDFSYNVGEWAFKTSTLRKLLNAGDYAAADAEFAKWNHADGKVLRGLTARRGQEAGWFLNA